MFVTTLIEMISVIVHTLPQLLHRRPFLRHSGWVNIMLVEIPTLTSRIDQQNFGKSFRQKFSWLRQFVETFLCL